jgi:hypothetical protein
MLEDILLKRDKNIAKTAGPGSLHLPREVGHQTIALNVRLESFLERDKKIAKTAGPGSLHLPREVRHQTIALNVRLESFLERDKNIAKTARPGSLHLPREVRKSNANYVRLEGILAMGIQGQIALVAPLENSKAKVDNHHAAVLAIWDVAKARESSPPQLASHATPASIQPWDNLAENAPLENSKAKVDNHHAPVLAIWDVARARESSPPQLASHATPASIQPWDKLANCAMLEDILLKRGSQGQVNGKWLSG